MNSHDDERPTPATGARRSLRQRRERERRILLVGLALSLAIHVLLIGVAGGWLGPGEAPRGASPTPALVEPPRGMRAVELVEVPATGEPESPAAPAPEPEERERSPAPPQVVTADRRPAEDTLVADRRTVAERLAPRVVDPRLWEPMILIPREPTLSDVEARVGAAVELLSDSALADAERALRARDWTVKDAEGDSWGISPGKLHLGKLTLPLPIYFAEEWDPNQGEWYQLEAQVDRSRVLESFESRVKAIRERRDRERAERLKGDNGG